MWKTIKRALKRFKMSQNNISKHITYDEATISQTSKRMKITNTPTPEILNNMRHVAENCFEPLREWYGKPIYVSSFYRCTLLNEAIGGSNSSQHVKGQAIDITVGKKSENVKLFNWLRDNVEFDQLINEYDYSWVHVSLTKENNRNQILKIG